MDIKTPLTKVAIENHTTVYLKDGVVVDASRKAAKAYRKEMMYQMERNDSFRDILEHGPREKDHRILRVARLLGSLNEQEQALLDLTDEIFDVCDKEKLRYVATHPQLERLMTDIRHTADFVDEYARRVTLWVEHLQSTKAPLSEIIAICLKDFAKKQREMATGLVWSARMASPVGKIMPPGARALPYGPYGAPNPEEQEPREWKDGKPIPTIEENPQTGAIQPLNWRYDPDIRYPTPYNKFLRFDGPHSSPSDPEYSSPNEAKGSAGPNEFFLPASLVKIRDHYVAKYNQAEMMLRSVGLLRDVVRSPKEQEEFEEQQKLLGDSLALSTGENYDRFSIVGEVTHDEPVEKATQPYVWVKPGTTERQVNAGSGTGRFKPADLNRGMLTVEDHVHSVPTVDHGRRVFMKRDIENTEASEAKQGPVSKE